MRRTDLLQVDTYKIREDDAKTGAKSGRVSDESDERPAAHLHRNRLWRSAIEVIVEHEVQAFVKTDLFKQLIEEKWERFGRRMYLTRTIAPYTAALACLLTVGYLRGSEINAAWPMISADGGASAPVLCVREANVSGWAGFAAWARAAGSPDAGTSLATLVLNLALAGACAPFLVWKGWRQRRLRFRDLDTNADGYISAEEMWLFLQKNLHFLFDWLVAAFVLAAAAARLECRDGVELACLSVASVVGCLNLINILTPFRFFGVLVIMMYKIVREDVFRFLGIYSITLAGFAWGLFLLFQRQEAQQGCALGGDGGCPDAPYVCTGVWPAMMWLVWVSTGDNVGTFQVGGAASRRDLGPRFRVRSDPLRRQRACPFVSCPFVSCPFVSCPFVSCPLVSCPFVSCPFGFLSLRFLRVSGCGRCPHNGRACRSTLTRRTRARRGTTAAPSAPPWRSWPTSCGS